MLSVQMNFTLIHFQKIVEMVSIVKETRRLDWNHSAPDQARWTDFGEDWLKV